MDRPACNVQLRALVDDKLEQYNHTEIGLKVIVVMDVFEAFKAAPGRFLEKDKDGWWQEISDADAKGKISKQFISSGAKLNRVQHAARTPSNEDEDAGEKNNKLVCFSTRETAKSRHIELLLQVK
jgi:hypothetical protein